MNLKKILLILVLISASAAYGQTKLTKDTTTVNALIAESKSLVATDSAKAITLAAKAKEMAIELKYPKGEATALKYIGMVYYMEGMYTETLAFWNQSLEVFESIGDDVGISNMLNNIGAIYLNQGADDKALEYMLKSLQLAEKTGDTLRIATALSNVGGIYHNKRDPVALNYLLKAIPLLEGSHYVKEYMGLTGNSHEIYPDRNKNAKALDSIKLYTGLYIGLTGNIGEIYADSKQNAKALEYFQKSIKAAGNTYSSAFSINGIAKQYLEEEKLSESLEYYNKALANARKFEQRLPEVRSLGGIADVYIKQGDIPKAIGYYKQAQTIAQEMDEVNVELKDLYQKMASAYSKNKDFSNAFRYQSLYSNIKDSLYTVDTKKKLNQLQFDFDLSKKEGELSRKEVEINLKEATIKSEKQARTGTTIGLGLLLVIAFIIYRNYLQKAKTNKILDKQKDQIEQLLLNILPKEVASELQTTGKSKPRHFDEVSVLFTDFKGFTAIADKLSPAEVVQELNECFVAFDNIVEGYGLEKIKTIGDAYMCAGNIPSVIPGHAYKIIKAAIEIQDFMEKYNASRSEKGLQTWEIRIGVHIGPVVAGVVGKKKYAYDIWGSTVNIASRMESHGEPGKVNISSAIYQLIKDKYNCTYRGKISAKNIGEIDMYFVENEIKLPEVRNEESINSFIIPETKEFLQEHG